LGASCKTRWSRVIGWRGGAVEEIGEERRKRGEEKGWSEGKPKTSGTAFP
jgi:hypothetical protein